MVRSLLRRLRGALGLGAFGSAALVSFGAFVQALAFLLHGTPPHVAGSLLPLAGTGFAAGLLASVGIVAVSRGEREPQDLPVLLAGFPVAAAGLLALRWEAILGAGLPGLIAFAVLVAVGGSAIGLVGAVALKIAEEAPGPDREGLGRGGPEGRDRPPVRVSEVRSPGPARPASSLRAPVHRPGTGPNVGVASSRDTVVS